MKQIDNLTAEAHQKTRLVLDDGTVLSLEFRYLAALQRWVLDVEHEKLTVRGVGVSVHPNILRQWRNKIDFGLAVDASDEVDPVSETDFESGRVKVYVLDAADVQTIETSLLAAAS